MPKKSGAKASAGEGDVPAVAARGKRAKAPIDAPVEESAAASSPKAAKKRKSEGVSEGAPKGGDKVVIPKSELKPISLPAGKTLFKVSHNVAARRSSMRRLES